MTLRSFIIGIVLLAVLAVLIAYNDYGFRNSSLTGGNHLPLVVVFVVILFSFGINPLIRLVEPAWVFTQREILVIWCMVAAGIGIPSFGLVRYMMPFLVAPFYFENNEWTQFRELIPSWLVPSKDSLSPVVVRFYEGFGSKPVPAEIFQAWLVPFLAWGIMLAGMFLIMFCVAAILRKQWVEYERLSFPLAQIPLEISKSPTDGRFFNDLIRNPITWVGAAIPIFFWSLVGLNKFFSFVPVIGQINWTLHGLFHSIPGWSGMFEIFFLPLGVTFLLSTEVSLSLWLFFLLANLQRITRYSLGMPGAEYDVRQQVGGYVAFFLIALWTMRRHLRNVLRKAFLGAADVDDSGEGLSYRFAVFGLILGSAIVTAWLRVLGCPIHIALFFLLCAIMVLIVVSRIVAQCGMLLVQSSLPTGPLSFLRDTAGDAAITPQGLTSITFQQAALFGDSREVMMPTLVNNTKVAERRLSMRRLFFAMMFAVAVSYVVSFSSYLGFAYKGGVSQYANYGVDIYPRNSLNTLADSIKHPAKPLDFTKFGRWPGIRHTIIGGATFFLVHFLRARFYWWPIHPLGILTAQTYPMVRLWIPIFVGWLCKFLAQRYARGPMMQKVKLFFLGIIIGDVTIFMFWTLLGIILGNVCSVQCLPG